MMYIALIILGLFHGITFGNWSSTAAKDLKQPVNFSGKLTTHQGQEYIVDNISVHGKYKQIPTIDKPLNHAQAVMNNDTKHMEIILEKNPNTDFSKTYIDLEELKSIAVPSPTTVWCYQRKDRHQKLEFIEIEVTTKSNTKTSYLIELKTPIYCDAIDTAGPQEKTVPLSAVKMLTIEGYTYRDTSKDKDKSCPPSNCPPCKANKQ